VKHNPNNLLAKKVWNVALLATIAIFWQNPAFTQAYRAYNWAFPFHNGLDFSTGNAINDTSACPTNANGGLTQGTSAISDLQGNLLIYSNGDSAWNGQHEVIQGGAGLNGSEEATQSSMIVPFPSNADRYYLFTLDDNGTGNGLTSYLIDMSLNSGAGMVFTGTQLATQMTEKICAVKHANDYEYWVITHKFESDSFLVFHVDSFGLNPNPIVSSLGQVHSGNSNAPMGQMKVSPDGTKIAIAGFQGGHIELFSFNNTTGVVSAPLMLESYLQNFPFGVEFSQDSRKLYYAQRFSAFPSARLYQYDLDHLDTNCLLASKFELAALNEGAVPSNIQLGTNGKIYLTLNFAYFYDTLSVINHPNLYGNDADYQEHGLKVDSTIAEGLPNFVSTFLSDGIHVVFGTTCEGSPTLVFPEDTIGLDSVRWDFGESGATSTSLEAQYIYDDNDTFLITLFAYRGNAIDTFYRNVVIWDVEANILGNDTSICGSGNALVLDGSWYNACLEWSTGATTDTISVNLEGWYWVDVKYQSCYFRDSIFVEAVTGPPQFSLGNDTSVCNVFDFEIDPNLPNVYYVWQDGSNDTTFTVNATGVYSLTATNSCGSTSDTLIVTVNTTAQPVLNFPDDTIVCDTAIFNLDVTFDDAEYLWSDGSTNSSLFIDSAATYWVQVSNICDTVSDTISVKFDPFLTSDLETSRLLCSDIDSITLIATKNNDSVNWSTGSYSDQIMVSSEGSYWYSISNSCGLFSDTTNIVLWDTSFNIDLGPDTTLCDPKAFVSLSVGTEGFPFQINWSDGTSDTSFAARIGAHSVTMNNECGTIYDEIRILDPAPVVIEPLNNYTICEGGSKTIQVLGESLTSVSWSNGQNGESIVVSEPSTIVATIIDSNGCVQIDSVSFDNNCPLIVFSGNVFSPDGDGINDEYCAIGQNSSKLELEIFNRWGMLILKESGQNKVCWDGNITSNQAPTGVYFYLLEAKGLEGQTQTFRGSFTLLR